MLFSFLTILYASTSSIEDFYDSFVKEFDKNKHVSDHILTFDPSQGRSDCEEQTVIMMDFLYKKKYYKDLLEKEKRYLSLRHLFSDKNFYDAFGMVIKSTEKEELTRLPETEQLKLRQEISSFVDEKMKEYVQEFSPSLLNDSAFELKPIGKHNISRISTTGGIFILFSYAKKYNVPVMIRVKRMKIIPNGLKGEKEIFLTYLYDHKKKRFVFKEEIDKKTPIFCIRSFSITDYKEKAKEIPKSLSKDEIAILFNGLRSSRKIDEYENHLKNADIEKLMMTMAKREDLNHKRDMSSSSLIGSYVHDFFLEDGHYSHEKNGKSIYTTIPKTLEIRHVYVSTLSQEQKNKKSDYSRIILLNN